MTRNVSRPIRRVAAFALVAGSLLSHGALFAQTATADSSSESDEATVYLNPFIIDAEKDEGYLAQNTASGSRLSASLKDTPAPISVFTTEFLNDIAATDLASLSDYVINTERIPGFQNGLAAGSNQVEFDTQFRIRGLPASSNTGRSVNFFKFPIEVDSYNTERIEFARGPNSILFGVASAAGNFNVSTKKAKLDKNRTELTFRTDENKQVRGAIDINHVLVKDKWGVRLNALRDRENSWRPFEHKDADRLALATRWQITPSTVLDVEYETGDVDQSRLVPWSGVDRTTAWFDAGQPSFVRFPPAPAAGLELVRTNYFVYDTTTGAFYDWRNKAVSALAAPEGWALPFVPPDQQILLSDFSIIPMDAAIAGPGYGNKVDYDTFTATLQHRFTDNLNIELAYNRVDDTYLSNALTPVDITVYWDPNTTLPDNTANPNLGKPFVEGTNGIRLRDEFAEDFRMTTSYDLDLGKVFGRHQLAGLLEYRTEETYRIATAEIIADPGNPALRANPNNRANNIKRRTYIDLTGPLSGIAIPDWTAVSIDGVPNLSGGPAVSTVQYPSQNGVYDYKSDFESAMIASQSRFWEDRIVTTFGYREDRADFYDSEAQRIGAPLGAYTVGTWEAVRASTPDKYKAVTRSQGIVFHVTDKVSLFYNHASNFALPNPQLIIFPGDSGPPPPKGESDDFGVKLSLFDGKVFATFTRYQTAARDDADFGLVTGNNDINNIWNTLELNGVLPAVLTDLGLSSSLTASDLAVNAGGNTFDSDSEGYEFELVANPTRNLRLSFNFSDNTSVRSNIGKGIVDYLAERRGAFTSGNRGGYVINTVGAPVTPNDPTDGLTTIAEALTSIDSGIENTLVKPEGARYLGSPTQAANLRANYSFREGVLNGFSVGGGVRWRGESVVGYTSSDPATRELIRGDSYGLVDLNVGYSRKLDFLGDGTKWSIQLNVNNVFDETDLITTETFSDGALRQYVFQTPRKWILTTKFEF
jgi:outer membrane receptor protein involved in Fe transport